MAMRNTWRESLITDHATHYREGDASITQPRQASIVDTMIDRQLPQTPPRDTSTPATEDSAQQINAAFDALVDAVIRTDASGIVTGWNRAAVSLLGYTAREALGAPMRIIPPEEEERATLFRQRVLTGETITHIEVACIHKAGHRLTLLLSVAPWRVEDEITGVVATLTDLSMQRAREHELMARIASLEAVNRQKDDFLATVSHELRTPLTAILGFAHIIVENDALGAARRRGMAEDIVASGGLLLTQVNDLLDIVQLGAGRLTVVPETVDLERVLQWCERAVQALMTTRGLAFVLTIPAGLPPVRANTARLQQVLLNFLVNAYKFTPAGGSVTLAATICGDHVVVAVRDTGIGIAPEHAARIFEPFERIETEYTRTQAGAGVGLAVARHLVTMMGGEIGFESALGVGSTFTVTLATA